MTVNEEIHALASELLARDSRLSPEDALAFASEQLGELALYAAEWDTTETA